MKGNAQSPDLWSWLAKDCDARSTPVSLLGLSRPPERVDQVSWFWRLWCATPSFEKFWKNARPNVQNLKDLNFFVGNQQNAGMFKRFVDWCEKNVKGEPLVKKMTVKNVFPFASADVELVPDESSLYGTIVGPSGTGKTSMLNLIASLVGGATEWVPVTSFSKGSAEPGNVLTSPPSSKIGSSNMKKRVLKKSSCTLHFNDFVAKFTEAPDNMNGTEVVKVSFVRDPEGNVATDGSLFDSERIVYVPQEYGLLKSFKSCISVKYILYNQTKADLEDKNFCATLNGEEWKEFRDDLFLITKLQLVKTLQGDKFFYIGHEDNTLSFSSLSGGQLDCFMTLYGLHYSILLKRVPLLLILDEPGQNLGSHQRSILRETIQHRCSCNGIQSLIVTHHVEMLDRDEIPRGLIRGTLEREIGAYGRQLFNFKTTMFKTAVPPLASAELLSLWFAQGVILVEGLTDRLFFSAFDSFLNKYHSKFRRINWQVLVFSGGDSLEEILKVLKHHKIPYLAIQDSDKDSLMYGSGGPGGYPIPLLQNMLLKVEGSGKFSYRRVDEDSMQKFKSAISSSIDATKPKAKPKAKPKECKSVRPDVFQCRVFWPLSILDIEGLVFNKSIDECLSGQEFGDGSWTNIESQVRKELKPIIDHGVDQDLALFQSERKCGECFVLDNAVEIICSTCSRKSYQVEKSSKPGAKSFFKGILRKDASDMVERIKFCMDNKYPLKEIFDVLGDIPSLFLEK